MLVKFRSLAGEIPILERIASALRPGFRLFKSPQNRFERELDNNSAHLAVLTSSATVSAGSWYQLVLSSNGEAISLFVDGHRTGQMPLSKFAALQAPWGPVYLGGGKNTAGFLDGWIDEVEFYARALSPEESCL
jgi:hypothetical protein